MVEAKRTAIGDITIIIKTFERPRSLHRLLKSIFFYYPDVKVVVADDSADPEKTNREVMGRWPGKDIEYLALPYDVGLSEGRNRALARVKTPYFVLCDDDFVFDRRTNLELMKRQLEEHKVDLVAGMYFESNPKKKDSRSAIRRENILGFLYDIGFRFSLPYRRVSAARFEYEAASKKLSAFKLDVDKGRLIEADMAPNFFIAKTSIRSKVKWRPQLKLEEHLVFFWDFKKRGFKLLINTEVGVNHVRGMPLNYQVKRNERLDEFWMLAMKIMKIEILEVDYKRMTYRNGHFTREKIHRKPNLPDSKRNILKRAKRRLLKMVRLFKMARNKNEFKPDFIGVGVEKCGTTWLAEMLGAHPSIGFTKTLKNGEKEVNFFNNVWAFRYQTSESKLEVEGIKSYEKYFHKGEVTGEWSNYYAPDPNVAGRIKQYFPNVKILFLLRNPVERVLSSYNFRKYVRLDEDSKTFEEAIKKHPEYTVERSIYYPMLKRYFDLFPRENIKVILLDDIKKDNRAVLKDIYNFLGVDDSFVPKDIDRKINVASAVKDNFINKAIRTYSRLLKKIVPKAFTHHLRSILYSMNKFNTTFNARPLEKESMKEETRRALLEMFRSDIESTGKLIGRDLSAWAE